jgi:hypothetical protein
MREIAASILVLAGAILVGSIAAGGTFLNKDVIALGGLLVGGVGVAGLLYSVNKPPDQTH